MALLLDATPQRDTSALSHAGLLHAYAVASPQAGASQGGRGFPLGSDPGDAHGSASKRRAFDRLHGRIPQAGPCSTLRRSLLHASARRPLWLQPFGLARVFAHDVVALLDNIRDIVCVELRVLSKNRDSASRGSLC
jgi:hypothetical protein